MTPARLALVETEARLVERLRQLGVKLAGGDESGWVEYAHLAAALEAIAPQTLPGAGGEMLTTKQMASRLGINPRTLLRRAKRGEVSPVRLGQRGRAAVRWPA
jgi:hypothetical protein